MNLGLSFVGVVNGVRVYRPAETVLPPELYPISNQPWILENEGGDRAFFMNDKLHRVNGPAIERKDGTALWFVNGKPVSPHPFGEEGKTNLAAMMEADRSARI